MAGDTSAWTGTPQQIAETPYDDKTMTTVMQVVKPMVDGTAVPA